MKSSPISLSGTRCFNKVYYFDSATRPNTFWVSLAKLNLERGAPVLKLPMADGQVYLGDMSDQFRPATPFKLLPAGPS